MDLRIVEEVIVSSSVGQVFNLPVTSSKLALKEFGKLKTCRHRDWQVGNLPHN
jgi:hypothetical protein